MTSAAAEAAAFEDQYNKQPRPPGAVAERRKIENMTRLEELEKAEGLFRCTAV